MNIEKINLFNSMNELKSKCTIINDNTIKINSKLLMFSTNHDIRNFLSNLNIIVDECNEKELFMAGNIKNSNITIKKLILRYESEYFDYYEKSNRLVENICFEYETMDESKIKIEGYWINHGLDWSIIGGVLRDKIQMLLSNNKRRGSKIILVHSDKFIGMEESLKKCFIY